jgi:hypothetical protein
MRNEYEKNIGFQTRSGDCIAFKADQSNDAFAGRGVETGELHYYKLDNANKPLATWRYRAQDDKTLELTPENTSEPYEEHVSQLLKENSAGYGKAQFKSQH